MRDPDDKPMWVMADGSTGRTSPYKVQLGEDDQPYQDFIDIEEETPFDCSEGTVPSKGISMCGITPRC
eukprot:12898141-Prorocentrum_lima.AAC.1